MSQKKKENGSKIVKAIRELVSKKIEDMGYFLWNVEYVKEGSEFNLIITIDKEDGITLEDCEAVTRAINPLIDEADPIPDSYYLEVSSAGLERVLKQDIHFQKCIGWKVKVGLFKPYDGDNELLLGTKSFEGILMGYSDGLVKLKSFDREFSLEIDKCSLIRTIITD